MEEINLQEDLPNTYGNWTEKEVQSHPNPDSVSLCATLGGFFNFPEPQQVYSGAKTVPCGDQIRWIKVFHINKSI